MQGGLCSGPVTDDRQQPTNQLARARTQARTRAPRAQTHTRAPHARARIRVHACAARAQARTARARMHLQSAGTRALIQPGLVATQSMSKSFLGFAVNTKTLPFFSVSRLQQDAVWKAAPSSIPSIIRITGKPADSQACRPKTGPKSKPKNAPTRSRLLCDPLRRPSAIPCVWENWNIWYSKTVKRPMVSTNSNLSIDRNDWESMPPSLGL